MLESVSMASFGDMTVAVEAWVFDEKIFAARCLAFEAFVVDGVEGLSD
jgi:hypothetical protein